MSAHVAATSQSIQEFLLTYTPPGSWCYHLRLPQVSCLELTHVGDVWDLISRLHLPVEAAGTLPPMNLLHIVFQLESGSSPHWQICLFLREKMKLKSIRNILGLPKNTELYYLAYAKDPIRNVIYCCKDSTRLAGPYYAFTGNTHNLPLKL